LGKGTFGKVLECKDLKRYVKDLAILLSVLLEAN